MDTLIYERIFASEKLHFYYKSNREFIASLIRKYGKTSRSKSLKILDVGCGTGLTAKYLEQFGEVKGVDINPLALKYARANGVKVFFGSIDKLPFSDNSFDLVVCFDVIYHKGVTDDRIALKEIYRVLKPGGICIIRVPSKIFSKSSYDRIIHTKRRYTIEEFKFKLTGAGYDIRRLSFVDAYLLPLILVSKTKVHIQAVPSLINYLLTRISLMEKQLVSYINLPFGAGLVSVVAKPVKKTQRQILKDILKRYLENKPAFLSVIRGKEALLFNSFMPYSKLILDYGCGDGFFMETAFMGGNQKVDVGLETDVKRAAVARLRKFYDRVLVYPGRKIPYPASSFSTVISNSVLEHVSDIDSSLKEIFRVMKKSGRFYVSVTTGQYEKNLFGTLIFGDLYRVWMRKRAYHVNMMERRELEEKFKSFGFKIINKKGYLNRLNTRFLDVMQYFSKLFGFVDGRIFMNYILKKIEHERNDGSFCCYFYVLSKK